MNTHLIQKFETLPPLLNPLSLQILYFQSGQFITDAVKELLIHRLSMDSVYCEFTKDAQSSDFTTIVQGDGPPASQIGLIQWEQHLIQVIQFDGPMPYGPMQTCVATAMIPPNMKDDAVAHQSHVVLYYAGTHPDTIEQYVALCAVAGVLGQFDASVILNEEARVAIPALDLVPEPGENALQTYRQLPIPYLFGGFLKMDTGQVDRPWVRTFANHRLHLPNLARQLQSHAQTASTFQLFAGVLGYLRDTNTTLNIGEVLDVGTGPKFGLRTPTDAEWFLDSPGQMLILEEVQ